MTTVRIAPCTRATAVAAVEHWHYSHIMPAGSRLTYAAFEENHYVGVLVLGFRNSSITVAYGVPQTHWLELQRIAFDTHQAPVSQHLSALTRHLRRHHPHMRMLLSYADPGHGHHGGIYQAAGWYYLGLTQSTTMFLTPRGTFKHARSIASNPTGRLLRRNIAQRAPRATTLQTIRAPGKHRYALPLDAGMRRTLDPLREPYPPPYTDADKESMAIRPTSSR